MNARDLIQSDARDFILSEPVIGQFRVVGRAADGTTVYWQQGLPTYYWSDSPHPLYTWTGWEHAQDMAAGLADSNQPGKPVYMSGFRGQRVTDIRVEPRRQQESQGKLKIGAHEIEVHTDPFRGGYRSIAFLPSGQQVASDTWDTAEAAQVDVAKKLKERLDPTPVYDPTRTYESEGEWIDVPQKPFCGKHTWTTIGAEERPGFRKITQQCPTCGKQRVLDRRILPKMLRPIQHKQPRPAQPACHHIWFGKGQQVNPEGTERRLIHECPKCGRIKTTIRRILPPR